MSKQDLRAEMVALNELIAEMKEKVEAAGEDTTEAATKVGGRRAAVAKRRMNTIHAKAKAYDRLVAAGKIEPTALMP